VTRAASAPAFLAACRCQRSLPLPARASPSAGAGRAGAVSGEIREHAPPGARGSAGASRRHCTHILTCLLAAVRLARPAGGGEGGPGAHHVRPSFPRPRVDLLHSGKRLHAHL
jgi:hypothetical protein